MAKKWLLWVVFWISLCGSAWAQEPVSRDVIFLKNGSVFRGMILSYEPGKTLRLLARNGQEMVFEDRYIRRIVQKAEKQVPVIDPERYHGWYNLSFLSGGAANFQDALQANLGVNNITGYQFHRLLGIGAGLGAEVYTYSDGQLLFPVFGELRGYWLKRPHSPYYALSIGYSFLRRPEGNGVENAEGGWMIHPAVGWRMRAGKRLDMVVDAGYKFQQASFTRDRGWETRTQEMNFRRFTIRMGFLL